MLNKLSKYAHYSDIPLRLALGIVFIVAGFGKITNLAGPTGMLSGLGFPMAGALAVILAVVELGGGILLLLGWQTRLAASLLAVVMLVAMFAVKLPNGGITAAYADIALLGGAVSLMLSGAKSWCLDKQH